MIRKNRCTLFVFLLGAVTLFWARPARAQGFEEARIYIEYNASANDLGFHVALDGEDWKTLKIVDPTGKTIFEVTGKAAYKNLGMTELFFEGAEPNLADFPLDELLALFPEGTYRFIGKTVDGENLVSTATLSHAVPAGPEVSSSLDGDTLVIRWSPVTAPPEGFPARPIDVTGYQVIVGSFQVTLPGSATMVTVPKEFVGSLPTGTQPFEVLAIDASGNQTITEGSFVKE
jgi:hypothetical protein